MTTTTRTKRPADYQTKNIWENCDRCYGEGSVAWGDGSTNLIANADGSGYKEVAQVCFKCMGHRGKYVSQAQLDRREKDRARREAKAIAKLDESRREVEAAVAAFTTAHPEIAAALTEREETNSFAASLLSQVRRGRELSAAQLSAVERMVARDAKRAEEKAERTEVPVGRMVITGEILSVKERESDFGVTFRMTVRDARGFVVNGTVPRAILFDAVAGATVTFTATVEASADDKTFGFYSRPAKASVQA